MSGHLNTILEQHKLRKTKIRQEVLATFMDQKDKGISHAHLEELLPNADRVTLYRTLNSFCESGIIHQIKDGTGIIKYALCQHSNCTPEEHLDNHAHFRCTACETTFCIDSIATNQLKVPKGMKLDSISIILSGTCDKCL